MNRLDYQIIVQTEAGAPWDLPAFSRYIELTVYLRAAQYDDGDPEVKLDAGAYVTMDLVGTSGEFKTFRYRFLSVALGDHTITYKDNRGEKVVLECDILAYNSECGDLNAGRVPSLIARVFETAGLMLTSGILSGDDYNPYDYSIDEDATWQVGSGSSSSLSISAEDLDDFGDSIPVWRRPSVTNQLTCLYDSIDSLFIGEAAPTFQVELVATPCTIAGASDGEIDTILDAGVYTFLWSDGATTQNRSGLLAGIYSVEITRDSDNAIVVASVEVTEPDPFTGGYTKQDVTVAGGNDGEIHVTLEGGSGDYTVVWADSATTNLNRIGLTAGDYYVTITDNVTEEVVYFQITILDAVPELVKGTIFEIPLMNSITFVVDPLTEHDAENLQTPDNTLFCQQYHPGLKKGTNYFQQFCKVDSPVIQFNSDFTAHTIQLLKYGTDTIVKTFGYELKEQNLGVVESFAITIRAHSVAGKSRVYFNVGAPPIPIAVGDSFEITNNLDGFNGTYLVADMIVDSSYGYAYLVINVPYVIVPTTSAATGVFSADLTDYNVYESIVVFSDVSVGKYFVKIIAQDDLGNTIIAISEPIDLQLNHRKSILIKSKNNDNDYGNITWTTGYECMMRVDALMFLPLPGGERSVVRDADFSLVKVNAKKTRSLEIEFFFLPPYLIEKLSWAFDADTFSVNRIPYQTNESLGEPDRPGRSKLIHSAIKVEQQNFTRSYNSDDIGSVNDGGFIAIEDGLLKI